MKRLASIILMAFLIASCHKELPSSSNGLTINMTAACEDTKTSIDSEYKVTWGAGEYVTMYYDDGSSHLVESDASSADAASGKATATFSFTVSPASASSYTIGGIYPSSALKEGSTGDVVEVTIPSEQNATATSYDPSAYIMVIRPEKVTEIPSSWTAWFRKAAALNKITLKGVGSAISKVVITSEDCDLCGGATINLATGETEGYKNTENVVSVSYATALAAGDMDVWFTSWNATIPQGGKLTVTAYCENGYYTKTITAGANGIKFTEGALNLLSINFASVDLTPYTLKDFAKAFVTCLDVWENTIGTVDADGTHNGKTAWTNVHLLPIINTSSTRYKNAGNQYDTMYAPFWEADLGGKSYSSNQCWEIAIRGLLNLCTSEGEAFLLTMGTNRNKPYTLADKGTMTDTIPSYLPINEQWGPYPWYEINKEVTNDNVAVTEVDINFLIKCGSWHIVRAFIGSSKKNYVTNYQEFGTDPSSQLVLDKYNGLISSMRELLIAARIYKYILDNNIESNVYTAIKDVKFDYGLYEENTTPAPVKSNNKAAMWVNYSSMSEVNLQLIADKGISDLFLHEYAFSKLGKTKVDSFIAKAHTYGIKVHIWMQCFWWNDDTKWRLPVIDRSGDTPASYNQELFDEIIARAEEYLDSDIDGINLDYARFAGNGASHSFPQDGITATGAITEFCRQFNVAAKAKKSTIILSADMMGETGAQTAYGQEPSQMGQYMDILIPMAYISSYGYSDTQNVNVANWFKSRSGGAEIWHGISTYDSSSTGLSAEQIYHDCENIMKNSNADGIALFRYGIGTLPYMNDLFNK